MGVPSGNCIINASKHLSNNSRRVSYVVHSPTTFTVESERSTEDIVSRFHRSS